MPYEIKPYHGGFRVCDPTRCFSNKALPKKTAEKQRIAIALSESKKTGKPVKKYFV
jgi:hypothetical protein